MFAVLAGPLSAPLGGGAVVTASAYSSDSGHLFRPKADAVPVESGQARGSGGARWYVFSCQVAQPAGRAT